MIYNNAAQIFNEMASEYDDLRDLWYSWLFSRLHYFLVKDVLPRVQNSNVLDIGCGTGFQSFLYAMVGNNVIGIDVSDQLIQQANKKIDSWYKEGNSSLFPEYYPFVKKYNTLIKKELQKYSNKKTIPSFQVGNAVKLPFESNSFDHINCVGSVLSFIPNHIDALREMTRVLKPHGTLLIEIQSRWNFNALWIILDPIFRNKLQINNSFKESIKMLFAPYNKDVMIDYPFSEQNKTTMMHVRLHSNSLFKKELNFQNFNILKSRSIHSLTNLIPSSILDNSNPNKNVTLLFNLLSRLEERSSFNFPACSKLYYCQKK